MEIIFGGALFIGCYEIKLTFFSMLSSANYVIKKVCRIAATFSYF